MATKKTVKAELACGVRCPGCGRILKNDGDLTCNQNGCKYQGKRFAPSYVSLALK